MKHKTFNNEVLAKKMARVIAKIAAAAILNSIELMVDKQPHMFVPAQRKKRDNKLDRWLSSMNEENIAEIKHRIQIGVPTKRILHDFDYPGATNGPIVQKFRNKINEM